MTEATILFTLEEIVEEYQHAYSEYKKAIGDRDKDYWDGYLAGIETMFPEVSQR